MKKITCDFILLFRMDVSNELFVKQLEEWIDDIAAKNKLADWGHRLSAEGRVVKPDDVLTDGPYTEKRESVSGYIIIKAASFDEAVSIAKGCPILQGAGTCVEVRRVKEA